MINAKIAAYARFERLEKYKFIKRHGEMVERKIPRYDVVAQSGYWAGWQAVTSPKGELYFYLIPNDKNPNYAKDVTAPAYNLQTRPAGGSVNFSGLRFAPDSHKVASGEASDRPELAKGRKNPLYDWRNDGFLFLFSEDGNTLEIIIITGGRAFVDAYRDALKVGGFNDWLAEARRTATSTLKV